MVRSEGTGHKESLARAKIREVKESDGNGSDEMPGSSEEMSGSSYKQPRSGGSFQALWIALIHGASGA